MTKRRESYNPAIDQADARRMCLGKMKFANKNMARDRATRHKEHDLRPYKCLHCQGWHLTHHTTEVASTIRRAIRRRQAK